MNTEDIIAEASIWIHANSETGEIIGFDVFTWNGHRELLTAFEEDDFDELLEDLPKEQKVRHPSRL